MRSRRCRKLRLVLGITSSRLHRRHWHTSIGSILYRPTTRQLMYWLERHTRTPPPSVNGRDAQFAWTTSQHRPEHLPSSHTRRGGRWPAENRGPSKWPGATDANRRNLGL